MTPDARSFPAVRRPGHRTLALGAALAAVLVAAPAAPDWLVTVDGNRIETAGPWTEQGRTIVFHSASGELMSMRRSDVDLDASHDLTRHMAEERSRPGDEPASRASVFRLTDADVGHVDDETYFAASGDGGEGAAADGDSEPASPASPVQVTAWDRQEMVGGDGLEIRGTLTNRGTDTAVSILVTVAVFDHEGALLATTPAQLAVNALAPGEATDLTAAFPSIFDFTSVNFDVRQQNLRTRPLEETPEGGQSLEDSPLTGVAAGDGADDGPYENGPYDDGQLDDGG